jgi:hypothetical protein
MDKGKYSIIVSLCLCTILLYAGTPSAQGPEVSTDKGTAVAPEPLAPVVKFGKLQTAKFLADAAQVGNVSSVSWANAFSTPLTLTGTGAQCVELKYSGEVAVSSTAFPLPVQFRALIDGAVANGGAPYFNAIDPDIFSLAGMTWWKCGIAPGLHTVRVQFRPFYPEDSAFVRNRTLVIEFAQ